MVKVLSIILVSEIFNAAGQLLFKKGANTINFRKLRGVKGHLKYFGQVLSRKDIWLGLFSQALCVATWILALAQADLSFVYPVGSIQYIFILLGAHYFLREKIDAMKLTGTLLVMAGIIIISIS